MKTIPSLPACTLAAVLAGCATGPTAWYEGPPHPREEDAVLSSVGGDLSRHFTVAIVELDGRTLDAAAIDEVRLAPGRHVLRARVKMGTYPAGPRLYWKESEIRVEFEARPGHSYLPDAELVDGATATRGRVWDLGLDYPADCLPAAHRGFRRPQAASDAEAACRFVR